MSSAVSPPRKSRRIKANNAAPEPEQTREELVKAVQRLEDELEELNSVKDRLDSKVTQLEERAQFLEADARLSASIAAKEMMDLKERTRELEIDLSLAVDGRDSLEQEKSDHMQISEREDEAKQLSIQLKEAWLRISTMKAAQEETVKKLFKAEETNAKLTKEVSTAESLYNITKSTLSDEEKRWNLEKEEFTGEIESLKAKLIESSSSSGVQVMDWEQDKKRMRDSIKHERATWDKEKKGLMDQIASLKIKATALHMQKAPPPEWVLEKHQLNVQCTSLQSRVAIMESERTVSSNQHKAQVAKLEKKVELLRKKLLEVMEHAQTLEAKAQEDAKQAASGKKGAGSRARKPKRVRSVKETDSEMESEPEAAEPVIAPPAPARPVRSSRARGAGAGFKSVHYAFDITSSSDDSSEEEDEEEDEDEDDANDEAGDPEADEGDKGDTNQAVPSAEADTAAGSNQDQDMQEADRAASPSRIGSRRSISGRGRKGADSEDSKSSDSEFEPPKKVAPKGRGKQAPKKQTSPAPETAAKTSSRSSKSKQKDNSGQSSNVKVDPKRKAAAAAESTPLSPESMADTPTSVSSTTNSKTVNMPGQTSTSTESQAPGSSSATVTGSSEVPVQKIKKKRRLLTGKGLDDLGDILNGPGMTAMASPSKGLQFLPKAKINVGRTTLLGGDKPPAPKEALNAIKMAFTLPKARNLSPPLDPK
ncbi:hypothetical protein K457DRAFT_129992 [Linnemannia elongata AG-77]|uniref:Uncharacterized protein n=1 Tax=Linnemannia elongata AG-77 TaxID=1314771 RepID=A0A197JI01_9FUNG|nr:hypothetical protein K457DRAFT_129992 [Linnemannia elongata AG-77]